MKSFQVLKVDPNNIHKYSELQVLSSAAGWFVGTTHKESDNHLAEPGSRDTCYFGTHAMAQYALKTLEFLNKKHVNNQLNIIRDYEDIIFMVGLDPNEIGYRVIP